MILATNENGTPRKQDSSIGGQKKLQTNVRMLRGHNGAITALHCVTKREVWDLVGDREDAGFFISGSTDCSVSVIIFDVELLYTQNNVMCLKFVQTYRLRYGTQVFVVLNSGQL
jgi:hypothetical protein